MAPATIGTNFRQVLLLKKSQIACSWVDVTSSTLVTYCLFYHWTRVDPSYPRLSSSKQSSPERFVRYATSRDFPLVVQSQGAVTVCQSTNQLPKKNIYGHPLLLDDQTSMVAHVCWSNVKLKLKHQVSLILVASYPEYLPHVFEAKFLSRSSSFCLVSSNWWETCLSVQVRFRTI